MNSIVNIAREAGYLTVAESKICAAEASSYILDNPKEVKVEVAASIAAKLIVLHSNQETHAIDVVLNEGSSLEVIELVEGESQISFSSSLASNSCIDIMAIQLAGSELKYAISLNGAHAHSEINSIQLTGGAEQSLTGVTVRHMSSDCTSNSLSKCVASGESFGAFEGMVYVAQDAQRTDANQASRNLELSTSARIKTTPQLEIYADDVKCTHGATVGQMDDDAVLYMRQRGLSKEQARRVLIEGFITEVLQRCKNEKIGELIVERAKEKLYSM